MTFPRMSMSAALTGTKKVFEVILESIKQGKIIERPDLVLSFDDLTEMLDYSEMLELERQIAFS